MLLPFPGGEAFARKHRSRFPWASSSVSHAPSSWPWPCTGGPGPGGDQDRPARTPAGWPTWCAFPATSRRNPGPAAAGVQGRTLIQNPPDSILLLERRAEEDKANFAKVFQSDGYFAATIAAAVDQSATPAVLTYAVTPGPRFTLRQATLEPPGPDLPYSGDIGLTVPSPFSAKAVVDAEAKITDILHRKGHPYAKVANRRVTADFGTHDVAVVWDVEAGPRATFGPARFSGLATVKEGYLAGLVPWAEGAPYDADLVTRFRKKLVSLDLFTLVAAEPAPEPDPDGRVPVLVTLAERKHRTSRAAWTTRPTKAPGPTSAGSTATSSAAARSSPWPPAPPPSNSSAKPPSKSPISLRPRNSSRQGKVATRTRRLRRPKRPGHRHHPPPVHRFLLGRRRLGYRASRIIKDQSRPWEDDKRYGFVFLPVEAGYDTRNDVLDPQKGLQATVSAAPYWGTLAGGPNFVRPDSPWPTISSWPTSPAWLAPGSSAGPTSAPTATTSRRTCATTPAVRAPSAATPTDRRAAGGNTPWAAVRCSPFRRNMRFRVTELIGIVPFVDGGSAFINPLPPYNQPILLGAGLGVRIYTPVGPVAPGRGHARDAAQGHRRHCPILLQHRTILLGRPRPAARTREGAGASAAGWPWGSAAAAACCCWPGLRCSPRRPWRRGLAGRKSHPGRHGPNRHHPRRLRHAALSLSVGRFALADDKGAWLIASDAISPGRPWPCCAGVLVNDVSADIVRLRRLPDPPAGATEPVGTQWPPRFPRLPAILVDRLAVSRILLDAPVAGQDAAIGLSGDWPNPGPAP